MKTSAYIGRIGGLAVALGISAALSSGNGVAWADTGDSTPSHSAGSSAAATAAGGDVSSTMGSRVAKPGARRTSRASTSNQPSTTSAAANSTGSTAATAVDGDASSATGSRAAKPGARRTSRASTSTRPATSSATAHSTTPPATLTYSTATPAGIGCSTRDRRRS